jgi:hypothetical protein
MNSGIMSLTYEIYSVVFIFKGYLLSAIKRMYSYQLV